MHSRRLTAGDAEQCRRGREEEQKFFAVSALVLAIFAVKLLPFSRLKT